jgi:hypothetical protein
LVFGTDAPVRDRVDSDPANKPKERTMHPFTATIIVRQHQAELRQLAEYERLYQTIRAARRARRSERRAARWPRRRLIPAPAAT